MTQVVELPAAVEASIEATQPDGTQAFFFFGTLMLPAILTRVLGHPAPDVRYADALLEGYVRHAVKGVDYPAACEAGESAGYLGRKLTDEEACIRGTLVTGLSEQDAVALDTFEGDEYVRRVLDVRALSEASTTADLPLQLSVPTARSTAPHDGQGRIIRSWVYVWAKDVTALERDIWDFQSFLRDKASRWTGLTDPTSARNTDVASRGSGGDPAEYRAVDRMREARAAGEADVPAFGKGLRKYWKFDKDYTNLNHGSYGSPPIPVIDAMRTLSAQCEQNPDLFMRKTYIPLLDAVRKQLSGIVNADVEDCVLVGNATTGVNTITWNIDWLPGDVIVTYNTTYGAVNQTAKQICDKFGTTLVEIPLAFPCTHQSILDATREVFAAHNKEGGGDFTQGKRVRMVIIDAICSNPGVVMPWQGVVDLCKQYGVLSMVDAAHQIGQLPVDLRASGCDFWVSNCHKWLMCHRGCAFLYVKKDKQRLIRTSLPTSAMYESERYPSPNHREWTFAGQYTWTGTQDFAAYLAIPAAIEFRKYLGGEKRILQHCHSLALSGGRAAAKVLKTDIMENDGGELTACMVNVRLPLAVPSDAQEAAAQYAYFNAEQFKANVFSAVFPHDGKWWSRMSAQVWNEESDFVKVAGILRDICAQISSGSWRDNVAGAP